MKPQEAERELRAMLHTANVPLDDGGLDADAPRQAWEVFKRFAAIPVDGMSYEAHSDALLFQVGCFDPVVEPGFVFDFTRQFIFYDDDGEYDGTEQLSCSFYYEPVPELRPLSVSVFSIELFSLDGFFELVEELPAFRIPLNGGFTPERVTVDQGGR